MDTVVTTGSPALYTDFDAVMRNFVQYDCATHSLPSVHYTPVELCLPPTPCVSARGCVTQFGQAAVIRHHVAHSVFPAEQGLAFSGG